jgi:hypothetical protein
MARPLTVDDLIDLEAIKRLKYRYLRCLDQKRWDELGEVFTDDATASYGGGRHVFDGRGAILAFLSDALGNEQHLTAHRVHQPEIDLDHDRATGVWAFDDVVIMEDFEVTVRGAGFYTDTYVRTPDGWRISSTGYKRTYEEIQPRGPVDGLRLTATWWGTDGRSSLG